MKKNILVVVLSIVGIILIVLLLSFVFVNGSLSITTAPGGANISIDGVQGFSNNSLRAGFHTVTISADGYRDSTQRIFITPLITSTLSIQLTPESPEAVYNSLDSNLSSQDNNIEYSVSDDYQEQVTNISHSDPILQVVPYTQYNRSEAPMWGIDVKFSDNGEISFIVITAVSCVDNVTERYYQAAREYLTSNNIDLSKYKIRYEMNCGSGL